MASSAALPELLSELHNKATQLRIESVRATTEAGSGHPSSCCSAADIVAALFFSVMRYDPKNPKAPNSDRFVLSKGHAAPLLYAAWAEAGLFPKSDLLKLRTLTSDLRRASDSPPAVCRHGHRLAWAGSPCGCRPRAECEICRQDKLSNLRPDGGWRIRRRIGMGSSRRGTPSSSRQPLCHHRCQSARPKRPHDVATRYGELSLAVGRLWLARHRRGRA